jgi:methylmalonic aciduria homocystinuria type C protein
MQLADAIARVATTGFDLAHAFDVATVVDDAPPLAGPERLGVLIGNTRALWPHFVAALPELANESDPLERYTERTITAAFGGARIYYAHRKYAGKFIPFQRIAVTTGMGALAPSRLVVHPQFGPWFALRAVVIVDGTPPMRTPVTQPCKCDGRCERALDVALADPFERTAWLAVRDACTLRDARYSDEQVAYHYTHAFPGKREHPPHEGED